MINYAPKGVWTPVGNFGDRLIGVELEVEPLIIQQYPMASCGCCRDLSNPLPTLKRKSTSRGRVDKWLERRDFYKWLYLTIDPSVSNGIEITTEPLSFEIHKQIWPGILKYLKRARWGTDVDTVGYHMHFEATSNTIDRIFVFIKKYRTRIMALAGRTENGYNKYDFAPDAKYRHHTVVNVKLSLAPIKEPTNVVAEFRACKSTTGLIEFFGRMELLLVMICLCEKFEKPTWRQFKTMVKHSQYDNLKKLIQKVSNAKTRPAKDTTTVN